MTAPNTADMSAEELRIQEVETAHARMRGHVAEVRRLVQQGAPATSLFGYLDQLEADLNTARPTHVGWAGYRGDPNQTQYGGSGVVTSPTGLSGATASGQLTERDGEPIGSDGLTATEREQQTRTSGATWAERYGTSAPEVGEDGLTDSERAERSAQDHPAL